MFGDQLHRVREQPGAFGFLAEHVDEHRHGVHPHQGRLGRVHLALLQRDQLVAGRLVAEGHRPPFAAPTAGEADFGGLFDQMVMLAAIGDQVADRADLQPVRLGEGDQIVHPRHRPVVLHDLADHARRVEPGKPRDIDRRLGMPGAHQHAAVARDQREDMAGRHDLVLALGGVDRHRDGARAIMRGNAGRHPVARLDRDGEGSFVAGAVLPAHQVEPELVDARAGERQANEAAAVRCHEVDRVGRRHLRGDDQIALILAVLVIDQNEHAAVARFLDNLLDRHHDIGIVAGEQEGFELPERLRRRVPFGRVDFAQRVGVEAGGAGQARARHAAFGDEAADFIDQLGAHGRAANHSTM